MEDTTQKYQMRRVVTSHDKNGKSGVWLDGPAMNVKRPNDNITSTLIWSTDEMPADFLKDEDYGARILGTAPPENGTRFIIFELQPCSGISKMHKTDTIDYGVCFEGEMTLHLDDTVITLKTGDVLIQRGTNHAWENRGDVPAKIALVLVDGKQKRSGSVSGKFSV